jgi:PAS domain S-box-containing protein
MISPTGASVGAGMAIFCIVTLKKNAGLRGQLSKSAEEFTKRLEGHLAELRRSEARKSAILESAEDAIVSIDEDGKIFEFNPAAERLFGYPRSIATGMDIDCLIAPQSLPRLRIRRERRKRKQHEQWTNELIEPGINRLEIEAVRANGGQFSAEISISRVTCDEEGILTAFVRDITERRHAEQELTNARESAKAADFALLQAQKLESIGHLAAGIAHEINTPIQYVGDNIRFLRDAVCDLMKCSEASERFISEVEGNYEQNENLNLLRAVRRGIDIDYLKRETPLAIDQSIEGVVRVAAIVRAMKEFSHPGSATKTATDINRAIANTVLVSKNEWKYVADMVQECDPDLPLVNCLSGELNQSILNLIVNAAHAIADVVRDKRGEKGIITIRTRRDGAWVRIEVCDTGTGIPEWCRPHLFNLFFTTKEPGKGTGQGLAFVHSSVVQKHGGQVFFETDVGCGTTFTIRLPLTLNLEESI